MSRKYLPTLKRIKAEIIANNGFIATAAKRLGIHCSTLYRIINENPELKELVTNERESQLDFTENRLLNAINNDAPWAIQFMLRTQGRKRGWSERLEITGNDGSPINAISISVGAIPNSDELKSLSTELLRKFNPVINEE